MWEEIGVPKRNPREHGESMNTPRKEDPALQDLDPEPPPLKATMTTETPSCPFIVKIYCSELNLHGQ